MNSQSSTPFHRAFAGKRNKMTAADVRKHVMTGSLLLHPTSFDSADGNPANIRLLDVVDPCDVEEVLAQRKTSAFYDISSSSSSPRKVSEFPSDDVELRIVPRELHTVEPCSYDTKSSSIELHVHDILLSFMDEFALVEKKYQQFGSADAYVRMAIERPIIVRNTPRALFELDGTRAERVARSASLVADPDMQQKRSSYTSTLSSGTMGSNDGDVREQHLTHSVSDPALSGIIQRTSLSQLDQTNDTKRLAGRHPNLVNLLPLQNKAEVVEKRTAPQYPDEVSLQKLIVKVLKMETQPFFEPIFGSIAIYDGKAKRKVSETFHFDVNPPEFDRITGEDSLRRCSQAAFNLAGSLSDLFMVVRLSKILQACDVADGCEPYLGPKDERTQEKLQAASAENASRLGAHRMPLGFMVVDLHRLVTSPNPSGTLARVDSMIASQVSSGEGPFGSTCGDITMSAIEDAQSIVSADRVSLSSTSTFRRIGSGTSAATVLNKVRTPLQKRKFLGGGGGDDTSTTSTIQEPARELNLSSVKTITFTINNFFRQETEKMSNDDLYKLLSEARKPGGKMSRMKTFPACLTLQLHGGTGEELLLRLNPDYQTMAPFTPGPDVDLTKDIQSFAAPGTYSVNTGYKNLLYLYPKSLNFSARQGTARNICIKMELMNSREVPQRVIFPHQAGTDLKDHIFTSVIYHSKTPALNDELKMRIPLELDDGFHILFTFYHISCKVGSKEDEVKYPIGYSWLPLYRGGHLESGDFSLPICLEKPPPSYGYLHPEGALPNIKWLDSHRPLFHLTLKAVSTVHPQDDYLENFFVAVCSLASNDRRRPPCNEPGLISAIQGILKARPEPMVSFLYNILDKLISLIARPPYTEAVSTVCFGTLGQLVKICTYLLDSSSDSHGRSGLLISYIHYFKIAMKESKEQSALCKEIGREKQKPGSPETQKLFNIIEDVERSSTRKGSIEATPLSPNKTVHEEIVELWVRSGGQAREMAFTNCWFFLELMMKSMAEYLSMTGRLYLVRRSRFSERFVKNLDSLSAAISVEIMTRMDKDARQAQSVSHSWAFFLRDAFSIMDRSYIMALVRDFNQTISLKISCATEPSVTTLMLLKQDFMRIICSHEHFVIMNIPFSHSSMSTSTSGCIPPPSQLQPPSPGGGSLSGRSTGTVDSGSSYCSGELTSDYRRSHFLLGIALADLASILESSSSVPLQARAIGIIRNLLATHEADNRLSDPTIRARVAGLYLPLLSIVLDNVGRLYDPYAYTVRNEKRNLLGDRFPSTPGMNPKVALAIAGIGNNSPPPSPTEEHSQKPRNTRLSLDLSRQLLICCCWVLKHLDQSLLRNWIRELPPSRLTQLLDVLQLCVSCFEYKSKKPETLQKDEGQNIVRWRRDVLAGEEDELILEGAMCTEVTLCVLDVLETIVRVISMPGSDHLLFSLSAILREIMHMLACNQSVTALDSIFASQRALIIKYPELVFEQETEQCGELCLQLLRHCASTISAVRSQAAASIYLLMRESYETGNSLARVKMQVTMSLSTLVSNGTRDGTWLNEDCLRRSLKTILTYAEADSHSDVQRLNACFTEQVKDLVFNLHMILSDTVKMKEYANDYEMTLDLMYRIAKGYQNNPDLRLTWLLNMASRHADRGLHCEAAQCMLHASALASEYIAMTTTDGNMPPGAAAFGRVSENVHEESAVSDDVVSPETDGICESRHFTAGGLIQLVEKTASLMEKAQMYELLPSLFKVIEPVLSEWRDYRSLATIHARISEALSKIEPTLSIVEDTADAWLSPLRSADKRCFGTYFRVGFYGTRFADLDGEEFIYKEPPFTKLSEISHRLETFYTERFGKGVVEVIKDSNNVSRTGHMTDRAYLQITYVEPYWDTWERRRRQTHFERSHSVKRFAYATPFTRDGKAHGDLKDQYKRRTILTAQNSFPYVKTRIRVIEKEQKVLQPIQVAIEDIEKKTRELSAAIAQVPADAKMLQMVLQGCIGTTVNQGPAEIANVFLTDVLLDERGKPVDKLQNKLRLAFRDFSKRSADALALNKQLIQHDQLAYQNELQKNYVEFTRRMAPIMGGKRPPPPNSSSVDDIFSLKGPITAV